jgi:Cytochrome C and Quinol oxidase polypeptide I
MDAFVKAFIKGSVAWLTLGATLGLAMALEPAWTVYRPAHLHMLTLGFVAMMIFGIGYHVIPRIVGHPLIDGRLPMWHWWCSNVGLGLLASGFGVRVHSSAIGAPMLAVGAVLSAVGAYMFAYLIWRTLEGPEALRGLAKRSQAGGGGVLPLLQLVPTSPATPPAQTSSQLTREKKRRDQRQSRSWGNGDAR